MWLLFVLAFAHRAIIYRCINAPGYDKIKIYGINGPNKTYLKNKFMIGNEESNNESMKIYADSMICDTNQELKFRKFSE